MKHIIKSNPFYGTYFFLYFRICLIYYPFFDSPSRRSPRMNFLKNIILLLSLIYALEFSLRADYINSHGIWVGNDVEGHHCFDQPLAEALTEFFRGVQAESIVDFGCGLGNYVQYFRDSGLKADGFDGNPFTPNLTRGLCGVIDLSIPFKLGKTYDWVMSIEVGEHLPKKYERIYIENLIRHCGKGIVLSWALKDQPGYGHFNGQDNAYIKQIFAKYGFINYLEGENYLREKSYLPWFKNTIMVFIKK